MRRGCRSRVVVDNTISYTRCFCCEDCLQLVLGWFTHRLWEFLASKCTHPACTTDISPARGSETAPGPRKNALAGFCAKFLPSLSKMAAPNIRGISLV